MSPEPRFLNVPRASQCTLKFTPLGRQVNSPTPPYGVHATWIVCNTSTVTGMLAVTGTSPLWRRNDAITLVLPTTLPVTNPVLLTEAIAGASEVQTARVVTSCWLPSVKTATAETCRTPPTASGAVLTALSSRLVTSGRNVTITVRLAVMVKEHEALVAAVAQLVHETNSAAGFELGDDSRVTGVP